MKKRMGEKHNSSGALFKEFILGGQDGIVNVLGVLLGVAIGTGDSRAVIVAGLAATFAESVSMGAVAYTSSKASRDYYESEEKNEDDEIDNIPHVERKEIYDIYHKRGFRGKLLNQVVEKITSNRKIWREVMMQEELKLAKEKATPIKSAIVVFLAALIGSLVPLCFFFFLPISYSILPALILSAAALFITGALEAKFTVGNWMKKGTQLAVIGMAAALVGFLVGKFAGYS